LRLENHKLFAKWGTRHTAEFDKHFKFGGRNGVPGASHKGHEYRVAETDPFKKSHVDRQEVEYEAFRLAEQLAGREAACWSSSWGGPQIMGFNFDICGYASATEMGDAFASDERWQVLGFADFCRDKGLIDEIQSKNWNRFGTIYNGDGAVYGPKIKAAYDLKSRLLQLPRAPASGFGGGLASAGFPSLSGEQPQTAGDAVG
jgi:hypothetical protein